MFTDYVDTDKFFLSYSIAPLFPYQYAHARRISCDTADDIGETSYMLNSLNYGWWEDNTLYQFTDPDHISFAASATEARTRYNSAVICGTMMLLSDSYKNKGMRELTKEMRILMLLREKEKHLDLLKVIQDSGQTICSRWMMKMAFIWRYSTMSAQ